MNADEVKATELRSRLTVATPFDQVAIARYLLDELPPWPSGLRIDGEDELTARLAGLLSVAWARQPAEANLEPSEADELVALLFPIALADPSLIAPVLDAVDRHERDESMNAIEILAYSAAISFVILVATTEVEFKIGKRIRIIKKSIGDNALVKLIEILEKITGAKMS
jgi:hypothetical protein